MHIELVRTNGTPVNCLLPGGPGLSPQTLVDLEPFYDGQSLARAWSPGTGVSPEPHFEKGTHLENYKLVLQMGIASFEAMPRETSFNLVGHSFGGIQAIELAHGLAGRVKAIVVIASPFTRELDLALVSAIERNAGSLFRTLRKRYHADPTRQNYQWFSSRYASFCTPLPESQIRIRKLLQNDQSAPSAHARWNKRVSADWDFEGILKSLDVKKIGIFGNRDSLIDVQLAEAECKRYGFQFFPINAAGHFPFLDNPYQFKEALRTGLWA